MRNRPDFSLDQLGIREAVASVSFVPRSSSAFSLPFTFTESRLKLSKYRPMANASAFGDNTRA